jgi:hypothetical protein
MKKILGLLSLVCIALFFNGCASGTQFSTAQSAFPPLGQDLGRVFFYRNSILGAAIQPDVKLNGVTVGSAKPKGFFFVDRPAGPYKVETSTEVTRTLSFSLDKNQTRYVRLNISMGFFAGHVYPELVDVTTAEKELAGCKSIEAK